MTTKAEASNVNTSNIEIDITHQNKQWPAVDTLVTTAIQKSLEAAGFQQTSEISVVLAENSFVQNLNRLYRSKDKPTNVLSFPQDDDFSLGDIVLALETVQDEALAQNKTFENHLTHLVIHGTLHLLGFDHEYDAQAEEMENLEVKILAGMGIDNPYLDSDTPIDQV